MKTAIRQSAVRKTKHCRRARKPREAFPYAKVARMWGQGKSIAAIAKATGRIDKHDPNGDSHHSLRNFLYRMHNGYKNGQGKLVKLPYRVGRGTVTAASAAGERGMKKKRQLARQHQLAGPAAE